MTDLARQNSSSNFMILNVVVLCQGSMDPRSEVWMLSDELVTCKRCGNDRLSTLPRSDRAGPRLHRSENKCQGLLFCAVPQSLTMEEFPKGKNILHVKFQSHTTICAKTTGLERKASFDWNLRAFLWTKWSRTSVPNDHNWNIRCLYYVISGFPIQQVRKLRY